MQSVPRVTAYLLVFIDFGRLSGWGSLRCCFSSVSCRRWISDNQFRKQFPIRVAVQTHYYFQFLPLIGLTGLNKKIKIMFISAYQKLGYIYFCCWLKYANDIRAYSVVFAFFFCFFVYFTLRIWAWSRAYGKHLCVCVCTSVGVRSFNK